MLILHQETYISKRSLYIELKSRRFTREIFQISDCIFCYTFNDFEKDTCFEIIKSGSLTFTFIIHAWANHSTFSCHIIYTFIRKNSSGLSVRWPFFLRGGILREDSKLLSSETMDSNLVIYFSGVSEVGFRYGILYYYGTYQKWW